MTREWTTEQTSPAVATIRIPVNRRAGWEQWALASSDRHLDNPKSNRSMQRRHLEQAVERGAFVIDVGDLFCAMQGKMDRRHSKADVLPEHQTEDYLGALVRSTVDFFTPYQDNLALIGEGNHEAAILKMHEFDLTQALIDRLRDRGSPVVRGGYRGWIRLLFEASGKSAYRQSQVIYYTHGSNSNAPVTKGVIAANRRAVWMPDANVVLSGHIHEAWVMPYYRARISDLGVEYVDKQVHVQIPTYKEEFSGLGSGYHHQNERPPKPIGAWWLRWWWSRDEGRIKMDVFQAE